MKANRENVSTELNMKLIKKECGAKLRGKNAICHSTVIMENGRCRLHGGLTPRGMASPHFKHGIFTRYMPENIKGRANEAETNETLLELREQIALFKVRLGFLAPRLKGTPDHQTWVLLSTLFREAIKSFERLTGKFEDSVGSEHEKEALTNFAQNMDACTGIINGALESDAAWAEMQDVSEHIRRLVESEAKRMKNLDLYIPADQANLLVMNLAQANKAIIREFDGQVCNAELILQKIGEAFQKIQEVATQ